MADEFYQAKAIAAATYANECWFSSRRGVLPSDNHTVVVYDNNPVEKGRDPRPAMFSRLSKLLAERGWVFREQASYPVGGPSDGYTVAQVYGQARPDPDRMTDLNALLADCWVHALHEVEAE